MSSTERLEFAPPPTPGLLRSLGLAIMAHGVLVALLTAGVAWKREVVTTTVQAELWSALPQEAAPPAQESVTEPAPEPPVPPPPVPEVKPEPAPQAKAEADIAVAKEKARKEKEKEKQLALEKLERDKKARELEKQKLAKLEQDKKDKALKEKALKDKEQKEAAQEKREAQKREESRKQQLERMTKLAGGGPAGSGSPGSTGSAAQASGPSSGYMGRIVGRIKPNIVFSDTIAGNPRAEVEIRVSPTGAILSAKVSQSSGVKAWDEAVVRAIEKTEMLPKDVDGSIPTSMTIGFRPKD